MRTCFLVLICLLLVAACTPTEKADEFSALTKKQANAPAAMPQVDVEALKACCDENARAMGAECCAQLDEFMRVHAKPDGAMPAMGAVRTGRPVQLPEEIAAQWPAVKIGFGPKDGALQEIVVKIGEKQPLGDSGLSIQIDAFVPAFAMTAEAIVTKGAEPTNPAAQAIIREEGKDDWHGWLFAKMPDVHAFEHATTKVVLLAGMAKE